MLQCVMSQYSAVCNSELWTFQLFHPQLTCLKNCAFHWRAANGFKHGEDHEVYYLMRLFNSDCNLEIFKMMFLERLYFELNFVQF